MRFADRRHAGVLLGEELVRHDPRDPVVYALPRGGVPVGFEVAQALRCPLDVLVVGKVGVPFQPELAMGAVAEDEVVIRNEEVIDLAGISEAEFASAVDSAKRELDARLSGYRSAVEPVSPAGHTAIVVDDGLATGSTALAALEVLEEKGAATVWLAVPVAPSTSLDMLGRRAERSVVLSAPRHLGAVGVWYDDFGQTGDDEVRDLLTRSRLP
jgi:putative phosphoribosyl transferase